MAFNLITNVNNGDQTLSGGQRNNQFLADGGLGDLNSDQFNYNLYQFPPDNAPGKTHAIVFFINIPKESYWAPATDGGGPQPIANRNGIQSNFGLREDAAPGTDVATRGENIVDYVMQSYTSRTSDAIALYVPDTVVFNQNLQYENVSLTGALGVVGDIGAAIASAGSSRWKPAVSSLSSLIPDAANLTGYGHLTGLTGAGLRDSLNQALGIADNPQNFLLFRQIDFRKYQFNFLLTPESPEQAAIIDQIIYLFRFHAAPEVLSGAAGRFFVPPSQFDIQFMHNGALNPHIPQINTCVCNNVTVDFGAAGHWATNIDGEPVQIGLSLTFTEINILTKDLVNAGF